MCVYIDDAKLYREEKSWRYIVRFFGQCVCASCSTKIIKIIFFGSPCTYHFCLLVFNCFIIYDMSFFKLALCSSLKFQSSVMVYFPQGLYTLSCSMFLLKIPEFYCDIFSTRIVHVDLRQGCNHDFVDIPRFISPCLDFLIIHIIPDSFLNVWSFSSSSFRPSCIVSKSLIQPSKEKICDFEGKFVMLGKGNIRDYSFNCLLSS